MLHETRACLSSTSSADSFPESTYSLSNLLWARGHYLSRRYPEHFACTSTDFVNNACQLPKEPGVEENGALVPLLDVLNHKNTVGGMEWLSFSGEEDSEYLTVSTNFPIK